MLKYLTLPAVLVALATAQVRPADAQTSPTPGPTNPVLAGSPLPKPGSGLVINPTTEECEQGWRPGLKWTKAQFETFCAQMKISR